MYWLDWISDVCSPDLGTVAYTGRETIPNMAGEARGEARTIPAAIKRVMIAVFTIYFTLPWIALSALPVRCNGGTCPTLLRSGERRGGKGGRSWGSPDS